MSAIPEERGVEVFFELSDRNAPVVTANRQHAEYFWLISGRAFGEAYSTYRVTASAARHRFFNKTVMNHPLHIHGTWLLPVSATVPRSKKHTADVKPAHALRRFSCSR